MRDNFFRTVRIECYLKSLQSCVKGCRHYIAKKIE